MKFIQNGVITERASTTEENILLKLIPEKIKWLK